MGSMKPDRTAVPDAEVVQLVLAGEIDAFDELVRRTRRPAYRLARRITRNHEDADDVVQDSYVKAYRALARFDPSRADSGRPHGHRRDAASDGRGRGPGKAPGRAARGSGAARGRGPFVRG